MCFFFITYCLILIIFTFFFLLSRVLVRNLFVLNWTFWTTYGQCARWFITKLIWVFSQKIFRNYPIYISVFFGLCLQGLKKFRNRECTDGVNYEVAATRLLMRHECSQTTRNLSNTKKSCLDYISFIRLNKYNPLSLDFKRY